MQEQTLSTATAVATGGGLPSIFGDDSMFAPTFHVVHGGNTADPPANQTVAEVRRRYGDSLGLSDESVAFQNGRPVGDDVRVRGGTTLTFMHRAGIKGR